MPVKTWCPICKAERVFKTAVPMPSTGEFGMRFCTVCGYRSTQGGRVADGARIIRKHKDGER